MKESYEVRPSNNLTLLFKPPCRSNNKATEFVPK